MAGKKFRFSLASVLKLRQYETEQAKQALAQALRAQHQQEEAIRAAEAALEHAVNQSPPAGTHRPQDFLRLQGGRAAAQRTLDQARATLEDCAAAVRTAREALHARQRTEDTLNTLREQEYARFQHEQHQADMAFLDEQAVLGFNRKPL